MTAAFWLKFLQPDLHVTIFEKSDRLGGWMGTKMMEYEGQEIPMETGPRTLRQGLNNYNLVDMVRIPPAASVYVRFKEFNPNFSKLKFRFEG
jgi:protoporphyrinogen/coproporphyrinogen III oxidase